MSGRIGSFNVKSEIGQAVENVEKSLKDALYARKQKRFEHRVSFKSAKVKAGVAKAPRKGMSPAEITSMNEARTCLHVLARPFVNREDWARDACGEMDAHPQPTKQALRDALAGLKSDQLQKIRVRATQLNAKAHKVPERTNEPDSGGWQDPGEATTGSRKQVLKQIVAACNDRLLEKGHSSEFIMSKMKTEEAKDIGENAALTAYIDWVIEPSRNLATALQKGRPSVEIQTLMEELAPGHKTFGDGLINRALFEEFIKTPPRSSKDIDEIGQRAVALLELTKGNKACRELNRTGWLMLKVHDAYYKSLHQCFGMNPETRKYILLPVDAFAIPVPEPTAYDKLWVDEKIAGGDFEARLDVRIYKVVQALQAGGNMETLLGPLEALATKIEWYDVAPAWDGLVAAFRAGRDLDLSRLREFGATLEEVATADRGAPGRDHALKIARAAVMVANAAAVAQGDEVPVPSSDPLTWGELCGMVVRGEPRMAYLAPLGEPKYDDPPIISGPHRAVPLSQLRSGANQREPIDDRPDLLSFTPRLEELEEDEPVRRFENGRQATEEPTESQRLSQEVTDLMLELTARRQLHVIPLLPPRRATLRDEFPPFDWELGERHFDGWRPSPSAAAEQLLNAIEAMDVQGYVASLKALDGLGADQGSKAVSLALYDVFKARSKADRSTMANNIGALHAALAGEAGVDEDILARSEEIADWLGATQEVPSISVEQDEVPAEKIADVEATAKELFDSIEEGNVERYIASLKAMIGLLNDGVDANEAAEKTIVSRSDKRKRKIFNNIERIDASLAERDNIDESVRDLSKGFVKIFSLSRLSKRLLDTIESGSVEDYLNSLNALNELTKLDKKSVYKAIRLAFDGRQGASRQTIASRSGEMHAAIGPHDKIEEEVRDLSGLLSKQFSSAFVWGGVQAEPKPRALKRRGAARQAQPMTAPPRDKGSDLAPVRRRRPQALPPKPQEPAPIPQIILAGPEQAQVLPDKVPVEKIADVEATAKKLFDSIEAGDAQGYVASLELLDKLNKDDDINVDNALSEALDLRSKSSLGDIFNNSERVHKSVAKWKDVDPSIRELSEQFTKQLGAAVERPATQTGARQKPPILKRRGAARPMNAPPRNNGADPAAARRRRPQALPPKPQEPAPIPQIILPGPEQAQAQALPDRKTQAVKDAVRPEHGRAPEANQAPSQPSIAWKPGKKRPVQPGYPTVGPRLGQGKVKTPPKEVTLGNEQYGALFDLVGDSLTAQRPETARRLVTKPPVSPEPTTVNGGDSLIYYDADAPVRVKESSPVQQPVSLSETAKRDRAKFAENLVVAFDNKNFLDLFAALHGLTKNIEDHSYREALPPAVAPLLENRKGWKRKKTKQRLRDIDATINTLVQEFARNKRISEENKITIAKIFNTWILVKPKFSGLAVFSTSANSSDLKAAREALNEMFSPDKFRPDQDPEDVVPDYLKS